MSRIRCEICGLKFGSTAKKCPHCGNLVGFRFELKWWVLSTILVGCILSCIAFTLIHQNSHAHKFIISRNANISTLSQFLSMSHDQLSTQDIAAINLACAEGLYGAEALDIGKCLRQLDEWAIEAAELLNRREFMFYSTPEKTSHSINRWRCAALVQFLSQIVGLSYNPALKHRGTGQPYDTSYFRNSKDFFIHGLITETNRGTCASMPVLFTAVARRMGYPIKLATTRNHLFARWDDGMTNEVFNIELTDKYAEFKTDDFYKTFPATLNSGEVERQGYLISLPPERELSAFLHLRAMCLWDHGKLEDARKSFLQSASLDPKYKKQGYDNYYVVEVERQIRGNLK